jgi:hypothetical protein
MAMAFHESRVVIIETGRRVVRAGLGLGELLHVPSVVSSRVVLFQSPSLLAEPHSFDRKLQLEWAYESLVEVMRLRRMGTLA